MDNELAGGYMTIEQKVKEIVTATSPVNVAGNVIDLKNYIEIYQDGQWSNSGIKIHFNEETKALVIYQWSKWQGSENTYRQYSLKEYMAMMPYDEEHFNRWAEGLRIVVL